MHEECECSCAEDMNVHAVLDGISVVGICQVRSVQGGIYEMERRDSEQHGLCYFQGVDTSDAFTVQGPDILPMKN